VWTRRAVELLDEIHAIGPRPFGAEWLGRAAAITDANASTRQTTTAPASTRGVSSRDAIREADAARALAEVS
jgi:hypothetical protein